MTKSKTLAKVCADTGDLLGDEICEPITCDIPNDVLNGASDTQDPVNELRAVRLRQDERATPSCAKA